MFPGETMKVIPMYRDFKWILIFKNIIIIIIRNRISLHLRDVHLHQLKNKTLQERTGIKDFTGLFVGQISAKTHYVLRTVCGMCH